MMSQGQLIFAICFAISFIFVIFLSYKKDKKTHNKSYKGSIWVLVGFIIFIISLIIIKLLLK
ncbi:hypothetical protein DMZ48_09985 [Robertkochia solimangrovi]|nr:hypothetical protein [Robertkochia solimangrovi]TRZ43727.1 hypothetical protein DMZ48_09985 [Robertkochia solimangrovi]